MESITAKSFPSSALSGFATNGNSRPCWLIKNFRAAVFVSADVLKDIGIQFFGNLDK
tara:strand:+ start:270 stop:440 length:171 start_codon:yes stop_codon:yes gene_type:complete